MEVFLSTDTRQRKQSGTEEEFKEKVLKLLPEKLAERDLAKQDAATDRTKEKVDRDKGEQLRQDALQTLKKEQAG